MRGKKAARAGIAWKAAVFRAFTRILTCILTRILTDCYCVTGTPFPSITLRFGALDERLRALHPHLQDTR
jgi:hypothetical protein